MTGKPPQEIESLPTKTQPFNDGLKSLSSAAEDSSLMVQVLPLQLDLDKLEAKNKEEQQKALKIQTEIEDKFL